MPFTVTSAIAGPSVDIPNELEHSEHNIVSHGQSRHGPIPALAGRSSWSAETVNQGDTSGKIFRFFIGRKTE